MANRLIATCAAGGLVLGALVVGVVVAADSGEGDPRPLPIGVGSAGFDTVARGAATASAGQESKIASTSDMAIAPMYRMEFELVGELPALDGDAVVWSMATTDVDLDRVRKLAATLGVAGDPTKAPDYDAWLIGPNDGTGPSLNVDGAPGQRWYFNAVLAAVSSSSCAIVEVPTPTTIVADSPYGGISDGVTVCEEPEPPVGVPSIEEAEAMAIDLAEHVGLGSVELRWETFGDQWTVSANAYLVLDGVSTDEPWFTAGFGGEGRLQWASGMLQTPEKVGDYPRIGTAAAFAKLKDSQGFGGFGDKIAMGDAATTILDEPSIAVGEPAACDPAADCVSPRPPVCDPAAGCSSETVVNVIRLTGVTGTLTTYYGSDNVMYLVPSYRFTDDQGGWWPVIALDEQYLASQDPTELPPSTSPPAGGAPGVEPPQPQTTPAEPRIEPADSPTTVEG